MGFGNGIIVYGNEEFAEYVPKNLEKFWTALMSGEFCSELADTGNWKLVVAEYFDSVSLVSFEEYRLREATYRFSNTGSDIALCEVLSIVTKGRWEHVKFRGRHAFEWQDFYFDMNVWDENSIEGFELLYIAEEFENEI